MAAGRKEPLERALAALNHRERSVAELTRWLLERDYELEEVDAAISELIELGALDDERFARLFAEDKRELAGWGPERIEAALRERGLDSHLIAAVCAVDDHAAQVERAAGLLTARNAPLGGEAERGRALGFLARRGYDYEVAYEAIRSAAPEAA